MKKVSLILNILALAIGVAALALVLVFKFAPKCSSKDTSSEDAVEVAGKGDIVYVQIDTLVNQYDMFNDLKSELEGKFNSIQNDLNKKSRAFENDAKDFQEKINKGLLTRSQAESIQNDLVTRQQELQNYSQQKQLEMQDEENVMVNKVMDAIKTYVVTYNESHKYSLILTTSAATNVVIKGSPALDITQDVLTGLNQEYIKVRNTKKK